MIIKKLPTGVPGLDEILGGGLPEFSFNIIAGAPGSGKTTLAHQVVFAKLRDLEFPGRIRTGVPWAVRTRQMLPVDLFLEGHESVE